MPSWGALWLRGAAAQAPAPSAPSSRPAPSCGTVSHAEKDQGWDGQGCGARHCPGLRRGHTGQSLRPRGDPSSPPGSRAVLPGPCQQDWTDTALSPSPRLDPPHLPNETDVWASGLSRAPRAGVRHTVGGHHRHCPQHRPRTAVIVTRPVAQDDTSVATEKHAGTNIHSKRCCPLPASRARGP